MARRICLAIGAANAETLEYLPGASNAAHEIAEWARTSNFDKVTLLTDEDRLGNWRWSNGDAAPVLFDAKSGVTVDQICNEMNALLRDEQDETDIFLLHFAGHGFRRGRVRCG